MLKVLLCASTMMNKLLRTVKKGHYIRKNVYKKPLTLWTPRHMWTLYARFMRAVGTLQ